MDVFFSSEFDCFAASYVTVVEDRPIMSVKYCLLFQSSTFDHPTLHCCLFVIAELLVQLTTIIRRQYKATIKKTHTIIHHHHHYYYYYHHHHHHVCLETKGTKQLNCMALRGSVVKSS